MQEIKNKPLAIVKFLVFSIIGIVAFFVYIPIGGNSRLLIDHITQFMYGLFEPAAAVEQAAAGIQGPFFFINFYQFLVLAFCLIAIVWTFFVKKTFKRSVLDCVLAIFQVLGTVILLLLMFGWAPDFLGAQLIGPNVVYSMGRSIIMILATAFFVPLLLFHGLIDAIGILAKPLMRPIFKTPGLTAVVAASDLLANFSAAILGTNVLYKEGKLTYKESSIILTGFCSISIGLMLMFSQWLGLVDHFIFYFISATLVMCLVTAITVRIPPIRGMANTYYNDQPTEIAEDTVKGNRFKGAWVSGLKGADAAPSPVITIGKFLFMTVRVLAVMISSTIFVLSAGLLLNQFTPIFEWLGWIFYPIFALFGLIAPDLAADASVMATSSALSIVDVFAAVAYGRVYELSMASRYVLAAFPVTIIIFAGGYFTCLMATDFRIKVRHLLSLWLIRMVLSLIILCTIAVIFFR
ncbi:MAG: hypothetical protein FWE08_04750 [Oscillospiraceae bacterium]|nr:hypothetical protein [Oscillospiraceae bacterium]